MKRTRGIVAVLGIVAAALAAGGCGRIRVGERDVASASASKLRSALASRPAFVTNDAEGRRLWALTRKFYERRDHRPGWIDDRRPTAQMDDLIRALKAADAEGLDPEMYSVGALEASRREAGRGFIARKGFQPDQAVHLDIWLTYLYMKYASDLADGISDLAHADKAWRIEPEPFEPLEHLERALADNRVADSLLELVPDAPEYTGLRKSLAEYRAVAGAGGWPAVPARLRLKPGTESADVARLARRLAASGDYRGQIPATGAMKFDAGLAEAVKRFQRRHGLEEDGAVGPAVVTALNVPVEQRIGQIRLNLERWRWLPRDLGDRHILVNIPAFRLDVVEGGRPALSMRVVVGRRESQTPIFNDRMTYLVFSPYWNVPPDIARDETLPAVVKDAGFLARNNMEVLDETNAPVDPASIDPSTPERYRFRQRPGANNSLGLVKFMFPNQFNVYLHDTPADSLFARAARSFSHGCVRVEEPEALAQYLLRDQPAWTAERIRDAMHALEEQSVKLSAPLPVYLGYWTAFASPEGVRFSNDVYGIDERQARLVEERAARRRPHTLVAAGGET